MGRKVNDFVVAEENFGIVRWRVGFIWGYCGGVGCGLEEQYEGIVYWDSLCSIRYQHVWCPIVNNGMVIILQLLKYQRRF